MPSPALELCALRGCEHEAQSFQEAPHQMPSPALALWLLREYATRLSAECGVPIESAMISDVPGYTWGTVSAMAQAGVKYFSFAPNYFERMGGTMKEWQNKPFWWKGPDGKQRVLCWCPSRGYALGHIIGDGEALARYIPDYLVELQTNGYPYDITYLRWNVHGDNGSPDEKVADVVRDWNARHVSPRLIISTTVAAFREFERRYGDKPPTAGRVAQLSNINNILNKIH
jgi:alpha-mannosidase